MSSIIIRKILTKESKIVFLSQDQARLMVMKASKQKLEAEIKVYGVIEIERPTGNSSRESMHCGRLECRL